MKKLFLTALIAAVCLTAHAETAKNIQQGHYEDQANVDAKIIEANYRLETNGQTKGSQDINFTANSTEGEDFNGQNDRNYTMRNESNCHSGNDSNFSHCSYNSSSKINQILHLNLGSAFIPAIVISFCLLLLFF